MLNWSACITQQVLHLLNFVDMVFGVTLFFGGVHPARAPLSVGSAVRLVLPGGLWPLCRRCPHMFSMGIVFPD